MKAINSPAEWARERTVTENWGLGKTTLYNLRNAGRIRSVAVREPGKKYGIRLYHVPSIRDFIEGLESSQKGGEA